MEVAKNVYEEMIQEGISVIITTYYALLTGLCQARQSTRERCLIKCKFNGLVTYSTFNSMYTWSGFASMIVYQK